jgi:acyl-CoA synthetase (AMP-forming)/AMP-acid ligase II/3-oxoacyl-(acyl-carrier-protein) synthase/acyl carrier protein
VASVEWSIPRAGSVRPTRVRSLVEVVRARAESSPTQTAFVLHHDDGTETDHTYEAIDLGSRRVAAALHDSLASPGGCRALLLYPPPSSDYISAFFGCMYAGVIPVPVYPPISASQQKALIAIIQDCQAAVVCTCGALADSVRQGLKSAGMTEIPVLVTDQLPVALNPSLITFPDAESIAFLQYTSGSTGLPKGVMVLQRNLLANLAAISLACGFDANSQTVSWLPPYHDMGLIGGILEPLHQGLVGHLTSPFSFLKDPMSWLRLVSDTRAALSGGPDFAYALCVRRVTENDLCELDLSRWRVAANGSEAVRRQTIDAFAETFAPAGFQRSSFCPCYGLAESTLMVTCTALGHEPVVVPDRNAVASGSPRDSEVLIVAPDERRVVADGQEGEIWLRGSSVAAGYWGREAETRDSFSAFLADGRGPYLRTGDVGYWVDGELAVLSRIKDLLIVRGRNVAPAWVEDAAQQGSALVRPGCLAAFALEGVHGEDVAIVAEVRNADASREQLSAIAEAMRVAVSAECGVALRLAVLVASGAVPKTTSGKVRRQACRDLLLGGELDELYSARFGQATEVAEPSVARLAKETESARSASLADTIAEAVSEVLAVPASSLDRGGPWANLGLDSLGLIEVAAILQDRLGLDVADRLLFDEPTIDNLASALERRSASTLKDEAPSLLAVSSRPDSAAPVAIVGMACRFPGADDTDMFWQLMRRGCSVIGPLPLGRRGLAGSQDNGQRLGALSDVDSFDALLLNVTTAEARAMDPQHRLLLEVSWAALEESGFDPLSLSGSRTGVYVGISSSDYAQITAQGRLSPYTGIGVSPAAAAGRISYHLGLRGPSVALDTACSSSLTAVHMAVQALRRGECELAVAGGVNIVLTAQATAALDKLGVLSPTGECLPFDNAANGYVRGEGCGATILVLLSEAQRQGLPVRAVIRGSAINHNGSTNGFTAPSGAAQREVIELALRDAGVDPARIGYVESHGSATPLGDRIELGALGDVLGQKRPAGDALRIGSIKAVIGHLEAAAGIAGLIKTVLMLENGEFPGMPLSAGPNEKIDWAGFGIDTVPESTPWPAGAAPRAAGVSSFGFSGSNAHVVLEEASVAVEAETNPGDAHRRFIVPVSAQTNSALKQAVARLAHALRDSGRNLPDVALTLAEHRSTFACRAAFHATSTSELVEELDKWPAMSLDSPAVPRPHVAFVFGRAGESAPACPLSPPAAIAVLRNWGIDVHVGDQVIRRRSNGTMAIQVQFSSAPEGVILASTQLVDLNSLYDIACEYYMLGGSLDFAAVNGTDARRVRLPAYPFERRRYWARALP